MNSILSLILAASVDCPDVINLAKGLHLDQKQPAIYSALLTNCCSGSSSTTPFVSCTTQRVVGIYWISYNLNGTINGTALPPLLQNLNLDGNQITGPIPSLPSGLLELSASQNLLTGPLPTMPSGLQLLYINSNLLTGDVPSLPNSLTNVYLGYPGIPGNRFTGIVALYQPQYLYLNDNWITDVVVTDTSQLTNGCDLSNNPLLGNPDIASLTMCTQTGLYSTTIPANRKTTKLISLKTTKTSLNSFKNTTISGANATLHFGQFVQQPSMILFAGLSVLLRIFLSGMILGAIVIKTPFKRHFKENRTESGQSGQMRDDTF